jgi:hypothetical protein
MQLVGLIKLSGFGLGRGMPGVQGIQASRTLSSVQFVPAKSVKMTANTENGKTPSLVEPETTKVLCDMPWSAHCGRLATHAYIMHLEDDIILYRCNQHRLRPTNPGEPDFTEIPIDEAVIHEVMRK